MEGLLFRPVWGSRTEVLHGGITSWGHQYFPWCLAIAVSTPVSPVLQEGMPDSESRDFSS